MKNCQLKISQKAGLSIIEVVIATTLTAMLILAASSMFLTTILSNNRGNNEQIVKNAGDHALGQMEFLLRNAIAILPNSTNQTCQSNMSEIRFQSIDGGVTSLTSQSAGGVTRIASNSGTYLTSDAVQLVSGPTFNCRRLSDRGNATITISFSLRRGVTGQASANEIVQTDFSTTVSTRTMQ